MTHVIIGTGLLAHELKHVLGDSAVMMGRRSGVDILDYHEMKQKVGDAHPESIMNCAAYTAVDRAEDENHLAMTVNALGAENVARVAASFGVPLIHFSTDAVFSNEQIRTVPNELLEPSLPETQYGQSKLLGERLVRGAYGGAHILRVANLYGEASRAWPSMLRDRLSVGVVSAECCRSVSPTWGRWVAEVAVELLKHPSGTYHVCSHGSGSWADFAERMAALLELDWQECVAPVAMSRVAPISDVGRLTSLLLPLRGIAVPHWYDLLLRYLQEPHTCTIS